MEIKRDKRKEFSRQKSLDEVRRELKILEVNATRELEMQQPPQGRDLMTPEELERWFALEGKVDKTHLGS